MHKNLFAALLLNAAMTIAFKSVVILDEMDHSGDRRTILEENWVSFFYLLPKDLSILKKEKKKLE